MFDSRFVVTLQVSDLPIRTDERAAITFMATIHEGRMSVGVGLMALAIADLIHDVEGCPVAVLTLQSRTQAPAW
jgi:hypothetical protein